MLTKILDFINLLEDDKPRISLTKLGLWGATLGSIGNVLAQVGDQIRAIFTETPGHASIPLLVTTSVVHAIAAGKAEMKRRTNA